ncbi:membrane protein [Sinorhizobium fredii USDA 205]|uniref:Uncharacterized protein n=1 Tax=Rhizobium fredii TaxID=380 RepID=A0A844A8E5_RHIFR|nr:hypothetical protein [Sinorhizobium fredii]KSV90833.1 membrane protein [Sinorhizobium fredii USDA 205]MQW98467.1 hypothetical protein [Sinorhizobium fredii]MQX08601.1 hypothetical protein [Sinorhizobium fredii]UTY49625.1 hypothetical protein EPK84_24110 [Sinorhizobium fredii]GEC30466.1 hypothetical protein EFR01_06370 [Sinorhizobium fredii]
MKHLFPTLCTALLLTSCEVTTSSVGYSPYLEPIPGSITYRGQPRTKLTKAPVGSIVPHQFIDRFGRRVYETYVIEPDRSLLLVSRRYRDFLLFDDD